MAGFKFDIEYARHCPFRKSKRILHDLVGPNYAPVIVGETEDFEICMGEDCMFYLYDQHTDTEQCLLGRKPYEI